MALSLYRARIEYAPAIPRRQVPNRRLRGGQAGTVLIFHDTLVHRSPNNMSPRDRAMFSLMVNPASNAYRNPTRPDYKHHRSPELVEALSDDCLLMDAAA